VAVVLGIVGAYRDEEGLSLSVEKAENVSIRVMMQKITILYSHSRVAGCLSRDGRQLSNGKPTSLVDKTVDDADVRTCDH